MIQQAQEGYLQKDAWLGLDRIGKSRSGWTWVTGEPLSFQNWGPNSGDNCNAAVLVEWEGKWLWSNVGANYGLKIGIAK